MPIVFHEKSRDFHIYNDYISYVIEVMENGMLKNENANLKKSNEKLSISLSNLNEQIIKRNKMIFGKKTEKTNGRQKSIKFILILFFYKMFISLTEQIFYQSIVQTPVCRVLTGV